MVQNLAGSYGWFQPVADGLKMLTKEDIVPRNADKLVHFLAPIVLLVPTLLAYAVLPYGRNLVPLNLDAGMLFFFAVGASTELAIFMAGWSSRNKYSLLGAMRAIAQMISYEIPLIISSVTVIMITGSLSLVAIVERQGGYTFGFIPHWFVFTPWGFAGLIIFLIAALAESNRSPFDIPEAESELIAGHLTEYSGFKYALFFLSEYLGMFAMCGLATTLFLGGWQSPTPWLDWVPAYVWFFGKLIALVLLFIWIRGTVPRLRVDQLLNFAWKFMLPMALLNLVVRCRRLALHLADWGFRHRAARALADVRGDDWCSVLLARKRPHRCAKINQTNLPFRRLTRTNANRLCHHRRPDPRECRCRHEPAQPRALRAVPRVDLCRTRGTLSATRRALCRLGASARLHRRGGHFDCLRHLCSPGSGENTPQPILSLPGASVTLGWP